MTDMSAHYCTVMQCVHNKIDESVGWSGIRQHRGAGTHPQRAEAFAHADRHPPGGRQRRGPLLEPLSLGPGWHMIGICFRAEAPDIVRNPQTLGVPLETLV